MRDDVFVYIAGPITAKDGYIVEENVAAGLKTFLELVRLGIPSYSPQLIAAFPSALDIDWERWMELDYSIMRHCTHMLMLPRWKTSEGAMKERIFADALNLRVCESIKELVTVINEA